jgi:hypothetical protein
MKTLIRLARRLLRRPAPAYHGWQDFELGTYVTDPAPVERVKYVDIMPDLSRWQEAMLKHHAWLVRNQMLTAHRRPEDARISIHNAEQTRDSLTVFGIPIRLDPSIPPGEVHIQTTDRFPRMRSVIAPLQDGGWSVEEINEDAAQMIADHRRWHP